MQTDEKYMARALSLARKGLMHASPNPMVGAVIVGPGGKILGEGYHRRCGEAHAEVNAVASVSDKAALRDSTMYVTLEPCCHYGRTGPCSELIINSGIPRVVVAMADPFEKVGGKGIERLRQAGVEVEVGMLEQESRTLNAIFITAHTLRRPFIALKWAQSADGFLDARATPADHPAAISTPLTRQLTHRLRAIFDAILVGSGTVLADDPALDSRLCPGERSPRPVVLDRRGRVGDSSRIAKRDPIIVRDDKPLAEIMGDLYGMGITSVLVEGGAMVLGAFINAGLWDMIRVETSPAAFGELGCAKAPALCGLEPQKVENIDGHAMKYYFRDGQGLVKIF